MEWIDNIRDVSILVGIWVAIHGLDSWRREHAGKRQMELAEDALALFYEARDAISYIRHPMSYSNDTEDVERTEGETEDQWHARKNASVVFKRYNAYQELFGKIRAMRYRFMAHFGREAAAPFGEINTILNKIIVSARMLSRLWARNHFTTEASWNKHLDSIKRNEAIFWEGPLDEDPINSQLDAVISNIETTCSKIIKGDRTLAIFLNSPLIRRRN